MHLNNMAKFITKNGKILMFGNSPIIDYSQLKDEDYGAMDYPFNKEPIKEKRKCWICRLINRIWKWIVKFYHKFF
jgi:hypothetical protein